MTTISQEVTVKVPVKKYTWNNVGNVGEKSFLCAYCGKDVAPHNAFYTSDQSGAVIYICPKCTKPTFFDHEGTQTPKPPLGREVSGIDNEQIASLYREARDASSVGAYTAAVLICRKVLMNMAVSRGAKENQKFVVYVDYLANQGYVPPDGKNWLDAIRQRANEATHEIELMNKGDALRIIHFTEMLLRFNFEMKAMLTANDEEGGKHGA